MNRLLDDGYPREVRESVTTLTVVRLIENSGYRYAPPFLATIASGLDVSLTTMGVALGVTEFGGLLSPALGRLVDRWPRRAALVASGAIVSLAALVAAAANGVVAFTVGLLVLALAKSVFDLSLNAWIADHVDYERRARVVGIVEMSWAGGLLLGVPALGLITAASSWRVAYVVAAVAMGLGSVVIARRLPRESVEHLARRSADRDGSAPTVWSRLVVPLLGFVCLMGASQCAFVTFGSWLEDEHGFGPTGLAAVTFMLGGFELLASSSTMRLTDRLGKRRAIVFGATLIVPAATVLAVGGHRVVGVGIAALALLLLGFEFAIVSGISLASNLVPGRPGTGIGTMFGAGTLGRAVTSLLATRLFDERGMAAPMVLSAALGLGCVVCFGLTTEAHDGHEK